MTGTGQVKFEAYDGTIEAVFECTQYKATRDEPGEFCVDEIIVAEFTPDTGSGSILFSDEELPIDMRDKILDAANGSSAQIEWEK